VTLPTSYADGDTIHGTDVDTWTTAINANTNAIPTGQIAGETSTATSAGTLTLTIASTMVQKLTGSTTHTVVLPHTSVVAGNQWLILNTSTGAVTVNASGGSTKLVLAGGTAGLFIANTAGATTPTGWDSLYWADVVASGKALTVNNSLTLAGTDGQTFTFPNISSDTVATLTAAQTLTGKILSDTFMGSSLDSVVTQQNVVLLASNDFKSISVLEVGAGVNLEIPATSSLEIVPGYKKELSNPLVSGYTENKLNIGTVTSAYTLSIATATVLVGTLTASTACTFTMPPANASQSFVLMLNQAATTGAGTATFTGVAWTATPTQTSTAGTMDMYTFVTDGITWYGSYSQGYTTAAT
jgi:hypothetical protein